MAARYGAAYELTEDDLKLRFETYDLNSDGFVLYDEFMSCMALKK